MNRSPKRSSRARYEDPLVRIHRAGRKMDRERERLGLSEGEYLLYLREKQGSESIGPKR